MLALQTPEGEFLDLPSNAKLDITGSNPAFDADTVARVFSFPFKLPASPHNLRETQHLNRLDAKRVGEDKTSRAMRLWVAGSVFKDGYLKVGEVTVEALECSFANMARELLEKAKDIKIKSLMPTVNIPQDEQGTWIFAINPVTSPYEYRVMINDVSYFYMASPSDDEFDAGVALRNLINAAYPGTALVSGGDPTLEIRALTNDPFVVSTYSGLTLESAQTVGEAVQANLLAYLDDLDASPAASHAFPMLRHQGFYGNENFLFRSWTNYLIDGTRGINEPSADEEWKYTYVPYVKVKYVFDQIASQLGIAWAGPFYESQDFADLRVFSNYALDKVRYEYFAGAMLHFNSFKKSFNLADHVPDINAQDFMKLYFDLLCIYPVIEGTTVFLLKRRDQFIPPELDFSHYITPDYKLTITPTKGLRLRYVGADVIQAANPGQLDEYVLGAGGTVVEFSLYPLADSFFGDTESGATVRSAWIEEKGSSDALNVGRNVAAHRIFFDRGIQESLLGVEYWLSTHLDTDMSDNVIGGLSLEWDGDNGLYEKNWKGWAELQDKAPLEVYAILPVSIARDMLNWDRPTIRFYHPMGETRAIVKTIQFDVTVNSGEWIKCKMETIKL